MAGDWIKMREDLTEDPAVLAIARSLETRPEHVVGYCHKFWSWVSRQCHDGSVTNVTLESVESVLNLPGFLLLMQSVGWLIYEDDGVIPVIRIPHFERHLSQGAKTRALAANRKQRERKDSVPILSRCERDKSVTREEKRREEKSKRELANANSCQKAISVESVFDRLKAVLSSKGLAVPRKLTPERREKIATRLKEPGWLSCLAEALDKLPVPGDGWQPDIDWLIANETHACQVVEGRYNWRASGDTKTASGNSKPKKPGMEEILSCRHKSSSDG